MARCSRSGSSSSRRRGPRQRSQPFLTAPDQVVTAANGDIAQANLAAGIVDKLGDRVAFGKRVAQLAGGDGNKPLGWYKSDQL